MHGERKWPMYRRILIPLDGSRLAEAAIPHALALASPAEAEIHLLSVIAEMGGWPGEATSTSFTNEEWKAAVERTRTYAEQHMRAYLDMTAWVLEDAGYDVYTHVVVSKPAAAIVHLADTLEVELLVISTHG